MQDVTRSLKYTTPTIANTPYYTIAYYLSTKAVQHYDINYGQLTVPLELGYYIHVIRRPKHLELSRCEFEEFLTTVQIVTLEGFQTNMERSNTRKMAHTIAKPSFPIVSDSETVNSIVKSSFPIVKASFPIVKASFPIVSNLETGISYRETVISYRETVISYRKTAISYRGSRRFHGTSNVEQRKSHCPQREIPLSTTGKPRFLVPNDQNRSKSRLAYTFFWP